MGKTLIGRLDGLPFEIEFDDRFSGKDYTVVNFIDIPDNITVYASCFSKEIPDTKIFPDTMTGVTFMNCNLDNIFIPNGNTVTGGSKRRFKVQNDLRDWEIDEQDNPIKVMGEKGWKAEGYSVDPKDIPAVKLMDVTENKKVI